MGCRASAERPSDVLLLGHLVLCLVDLGAILRPGIKSYYEMFLSQPENSHRKILYKLYVLIDGEFSEDFICEMFELVCASLSQSLTLLPMNSTCLALDFLKNLRNEQKNWCLIWLWDLYRLRGRKFCDFSRFSLIPKKYVCISENE